jgi:ABC-2 type transport system ATP-binding protein
LTLAAHSIEAVNLTKSYGSFTALSSLNLKIEGSKCVGFLGPNGAGKTTTLKIFTDLIRPTSGRAEINGFNVHTHKKAALASVGTVIETPEIYPSLTPREALGMVAELRGIPRPEQKKQIDEVVTEVGMEEWVDKRTGKFSKGMKQRICIASALLGDPSIVILDEPTTGLDPRGMSEVRGIVKSLKNKDRLIFMSSHILSEVEDICDEVAMIDHGKLLVYDTLQNVTTKFAGGGSNVVDVGLIRALPPNAVGDSITKLPGVVSVQRLDDRRLRLSLSGGADTQEKILAALVESGIGVVSFQPASSALEESYLHLIKDTL